MKIKLKSVIVERRNEVARDEGVFGEATYVGEDGAVSHERFHAVVKRLEGEDELERGGRKQMNEKGEDARG